MPIRSDDPDLVLEAKILKAVTRGVAPYAQEVDELKESLATVNRALQSYAKQIREMQESAERTTTAAEEAAKRLAKNATEDRERLAINVREAAERQASEVAEKVVDRMMRSLGLDPDKPTDFVKDMLFVKELRETFSAARKHAITVLVGIVMMGIATGIWASLKSGAIKP